MFFLVESTCLCKLAFFDRRRELTTHVGWVVPQGVSEEPATGKQKPIATALCFGRSGSGPVLGLGADQRKVAGNHFIGPPLRLVWFELVESVFDHQRQLHFAVVGAAAFQAELAGNIREGCRLLVS